MCEAQQAIPDAIAVTSDGPTRRRLWRLYDELQGSFLDPSNTDEELMALFYKAGVLGMYLECPKEAFDVKGLRRFAEPALDEVPDGHRHFDNGVRYVTALLGGCH